MVMLESPVMEVSRLQLVTGWLHDAAPAIWRGLGALESAQHDAELAEVVIDRPIYVTGLARSGTTILLELLHRNEATASHRYRDFPFLEAPIAWDRFLRHALKEAWTPAERAHGDGLMVTPDSPEAMEEILWARFFETAHDPMVSNVLSRETKNPAFARFYRDHIKKLLWLRGGKRYLAKGNYNLTRLPYLAELFPDARFVIALREPKAAIASSMGQHQRFCAAAARNSRLTRYLTRAGHFEFGPARRPICCGEPRETARIQAHWDAGEEAVGWALYWRALHRWLKDALDRDPPLARQTIIVDHGRLGDDPRGQLQALHRRLDLPLGEDALAALAREIKPRASATRLSEAERRVIDAETGELYAALRARCL